MASKFINVVKTVVVDSIARLFSKSYYVTQIARRVSQLYDNDCNPDMQTNGELLLIKQIVSRRKNGVFFDIGANKGMSFPSKASKEDDCYRPIAIKHYVSNKGS